MKLSIRERRGAKINFMAFRMHIRYERSSTFELQLQRSAPKVLDSVSALNLFSEGKPIARDPRTMFWEGLEGVYSGMNRDPSPKLDEERCISGVFLSALSGQCSRRHVIRDLGVQDFWCRPPYSVGSDRRQAHILRTHDPSSMQECYG